MHSGNYLCKGMQLRDCSSVFQEPQVIDHDRSTVYLSVCVGVEVMVEVRLGM